MARLPTGTQGNRRQRRRYNTREHRRIMRRRNRERQFEIVRGPGYYSRA